MANFIFTKRLANYNLACVTMNTLSKPRSIKSLNKKQSNVQSITKKRRMAAADLKIIEYKEFRTMPQMVESLSITPARSFNVLSNDLTKRLLNFWLGESAYWYDTSVKKINESYFGEPDFYQPLFQARPDLDKWNYLGSLSKMQILRLFYKET